MPNSVAANGGERPEPLALVFPGQGSQSLGMAGKVIRVHPQVRERFETASEILGYNLLEVIERGPEASLGDTWHSQPAIYTASIAWLDALKVTWARNGRHLKPVAMAGHSLGQVTALVAAGALDFESGLVLVKERARLMHEAGRSRPGGMASIIGLRDRVLQRIVREARSHGILVVANENGPGHTVVSGDEGALQRVLRVAEARGARRAVRLPISIASHSPLMESAQEQFRKTVQAMPWRDPLVPVVGNVSASVLETKEAIRVELSDALCRPVRWADSVTAMVNRGAVLFVEAGPGDVLSKLVRRISRSAWTFPLSDEEEGLAARDYPTMDGIPK